MAYGSINVPGVSKKELLDAVEGKQDKITSGASLIPPGAAWKTDTDPDYPNYVDNLPSIPALTANDRVDIIITESADKALAVKCGFSPVITLNSSNKPVIRAKDKPGSSEMIMSAKYMITKDAGKYGTLTYGTESESRPTFILNWRDPCNVPATPEQTSANVETFKKILECGVNNCTVYLKVATDSSSSAIDDNSYILTVPVNIEYTRNPRTDSESLSFQALVGGANYLNSYFDEVVNCGISYDPESEESVDYWRFPLVAHSENSPGIDNPMYDNDYIAPSIRYMEEYVAKKIKEALGK